jgi:hypothetical protein
MTRATSEDCWYHFPNCHAKCNSLQLKQLEIKNKSNTKYCLLTVNIKDREITQKYMVQEFLSCFYFYIQLKNSINIVK